MDAFKRLTTTAAAAALATALTVGPVFAVEDEVEPAPVDEGGRIELVETQRDRLGLLLLTGLVVAGGFGLANARRQLKGERPQASGEFRWR